MINKQFWSLAGGLRNIKLSGQVFRCLQSLLWAVLISSRNDHQRCLKTWFPISTPGAGAPLCCAEACVLTALVLIHVDQIDGAAPHRGTCEETETVHVGRNRLSGKWECLRLALLLEKTLKELHPVPELISDGEKDLF